MPWKQMYRKQNTKKLFFFGNTLILSDTITVDIYDTAPCTLKRPYTVQNIYKHYNTGSGFAHKSRSKSISFPDSFVFDRYLANMLQKTIWVCNLTSETEIIGQLSWLKVNLYRRSETRLKAPCNALCQLQLNIVIFSTAISCMARHCKSWNIMFCNWKTVSTKLCTLTNNPHLKCTTWYTKSVARKASSKIFFGLSNSWCEGSRSARRHFWDFKNSYQVYVNWSIWADSFSPVLHQKHPCRITLFEQKQNFSKLA